MTELQSEIHSGHDHGFLGEVIESFISHLPLSENVREFLTHFFTDTITIFFLLIVIMAAVYFLSSYVNMDKLHHKLAHLKSIPGFLLATAAGVLSPFCSCSIMPVLIGLLSVGVPVSVCLCYLTASSLINLTAIVSVYAVAGPYFGTAYLIGSLIILLLSSLFFSFLKLDSTIKDYSHDHHHHHEECAQKIGMASRLQCAFRDTFHVLKKCALFIVIGVLLSSGIMAFFSMDTITRIVNENSQLSALIVSLIGIPIHSDIFSISPILTLLLEISPAVALAFTLSTMAISVPSIVILTRALKAKTVACYCATIILLSLFIGILSTFLFL